MDTEISKSKTKWSLSEFYKFGKFQKQVMLLLFLASIPNGISTIILVFIHDVPTHHCKPDPNISLAIAVGGTDLNSSLFNIPTELDAQGIEVPSSCLKFKVNSNYTGNNLNISGALTVVQCDQGWVYNIKENQATVVTEWDLVCDNAWIRPLMTTLNLFGFLIGSMTSGVISDRFGRRPVFLITTFIQFISLFVASFAPTIESYAVMIFLIGLTGLINYQSAFVLGVELVEPSKRALMGTLINVAYATGYMLLPGIAYLLPDWRWLTRVSGLMGVLYQLFDRLIPESPRWLIRAGRVDEAKVILKKIAEVNKTTISVVDAKQLLNSKNVDSEDSVPVQQLSYLDLFRIRDIRTRSLCIFLSWFSVGLLYFMISLNTSSLGGNKYVNCFLSAAVEIPAIITTYFTLEKIGRVLPLSISFFIASLVYGSIPLLMQVNQTAVIVAAMISKFLATFIFLLIYIYTCEPFPTMMRHKSLGAASTIARMGGMVMPYLVYAGKKVHFSFPYIVMCVIGVLTGVSAMCLPETLNEPTPDTMEDALKLKRKYFTSCCGKNNDNGFVEEEDSDEVRI
ncbi:organic cation/carnitine transporter 2 isoform X1 [Ciona intestinalis]